MSRLALWLCLAFCAAGCIRVPVPPDDDDVVDPDDKPVVRATIRTATEGYDATLRDAYLRAAVKLEEAQRKIDAGEPRDPGDWDTDKKYGDGFELMRKDALKSAMQDLANREQRETAGVDKDGRPRWKPGKAAEYARTIAGEKN